MKQFKPKEIVKFLKEYGYVEDHFTGSHLIMYNPKTRVRAVVPVHKKDLPIWTLKAILRQTWLTIEDMKKYFNF